MAIDIDGYGVLQAIAAKPDVFGEIKADVAKAAMALMTKQLKAKSLTLDKTKKIFELLKSKQFSNVLDGLKENEVRAFVKKIDKNNADAAQATADKNRKLLIGLAEGSVLPTQKTQAPTKSRAAKAPTKRKVTRAISSEAMAARWDGANPDDPKG